MAEYALVQSGRVVNVVIIAPTDTATMSMFKAQYQDVVDVDGLSPQPTIGWTQPGGPGTALVAPPAPPSLTASPTSTPGDGASVSTVTYTKAGATGAVTFNINGSPVSANLTNGSASVGVSSVYAGDSITVTCAGLAVEILVSTPSGPAPAPTQGAVAALPSSNYIVTHANAQFAALLQQGQADLQTLSGSADALAPILARTLSALILLAQATAAIAQEAGVQL